MRSLADQDETQLGGVRSLLVRQQRDHQRLRALLERLTPSAGPAQDELLREIYRVVFPHVFADESVLWPVVRKELPYGETLVQQMDDERDDVNELVGRLQDEGLEVSQRSRLLDRLRKVLLEAVRHEEDVLLPALQSRVAMGRLRQLGIAWEVVRRAAPTRPHRILVRHRASNSLALLPLTLLDRSRDLLESSFPPGPHDDSTPLRVAS